MFSLKLFTTIFLIAIASTTTSSQTFQGTMTRESKTKKLELPVQFDLVIPDGSGKVTGTYFYRKIGQKIDLAGTTDGQTVSLSERDGKTGNIAGTFILEYSDEQLSGVWNKSGSKDTFQVLLNLDKPVSIDGFWEGFVGKDKVRFFLTSYQDEQYGLYYLSSEKFLINCEFNLSDSTITEIYSDYPEKNVSGGIWKYSYVTNDTMRGTITEYLHYNTEYKPGTPFTLVKRPTSFCDNFYSGIDSGFVITIEDTTDWADQKQYSKISVHNSGLNYGGVKIVSPIPKQVKVNQLLQTIIPLNGEPKIEVLKQRKGNCALPSDYEDYADVKIIDWGNRYLTVMIETGEFPRYLKYKNVIIDLDKAEEVDPSVWFKDSVKFLAGSEEWSDNSENYWDEDLQKFFIKLSKDGKIDLKSVNEDDKLFIINNKKVNFYSPIISPSEEGINVQLRKVDSEDEFVTITLNYNDIAKYLTPAGVKELKTKN
jgi:hypothetical protein